MLQDTSLELMAQTDRNQRLGISHAGRRQCEDLRRLACRDLLMDRDGLHVGAFGERIVHSGAELVSIASENHVGRIVIRQHQCIGDGDV